MTGLTLLHVPSQPCLHLPSGTLLVFIARKATIAKSVTFRIHINETISWGSLGFCNIKKKKKVWQFNAEIEVFPMSTHTPE